MHKSTCHLINKKPLIITDGFSKMSMVLFSSNPGANRTNDQWLKRPFL